ncbi:hypothetical protein SUGI_0724320 [Cryptomeria japonica]|nr:hypothetical protein SUGI_0724320 [Cryptomeria japonica]
MLRSEFAYLPPVLPGIQQAYGFAKERCSATLINTFDGLEAEYVKYLEESTDKPVWSIASPLHKPQFGVDNESEFIRWLDTQKENSVLYISFGFQGFLSEDQTKALARGIAASNQPFIWSIKDPVGSQVNSCDFLPEGFIEETRDRGMVIHGWVPQLLILSHPSTAYFLSHCGWNSTLEGISAGVPMLAWPLMLDQFAKFRLGLQLCEGFDAITSSYVVENTVKTAMTAEIGKEMCLRALQIKESINEASCKLSVKSFVSYILSHGLDEDK